MNKSEALSILSDIANAAIQLRDESRPNHHLAISRWNGVAKDAHYHRNNLCATVGEEEAARELRVFKRFLGEHEVQRLAELRGTERVRAAVAAVKAEWEATLARFDAKIAAMKSAVA